MKKITAILILLTLTVCSCRTQLVETVHYEPVEVHDTVNVIAYQHDSITLHDSVFIHQKGDTVYSEKWRTEYRWRVSHDTVYRSKEVPYIVTDTICQIREVPVERIVYRQRWWQKLLSGTGLMFILGLILTLLIRYKR